MKVEINFLGDDWQNAEAEEYKKLLVAELSPIITRPLWIGSLLTFLGSTESPPTNIKQERNWYLVLGPHYLVLYDDDFKSQNARIEDLAHYIKDVTTIKELELLKLYGSNNAIVPVGLNKMLNFFPYLFNVDRAGWAMSLDTRTQEIVSIRVSKHPRTRDDSKEDIDSKFRADSKRDFIKSRIVDNSGRELKVLPVLNGDASLNTGLIRYLESNINDLSLPGSRSVVIWREGRDALVCGGTHLTAQSSEFISLCESFERFQVMYHSTNTKLVFDSFFNLKQEAVIDPVSLFYDSTKRKYDEHIPIYWTDAFELSSGSAVMVPAQEIWFDNENLAGETLWISNTTNGCAVGSSFEEAVLFALFEALERDAFLGCWYLKRRCNQIPLSQINDSQFHLLIAKIKYLKPNYQLFFLNLQNDIKVPVVAAIAVRKSGAGPKFLCAAAARLTYSQAAHAALKDIQGLLAFPPDDTQMKHFFKLSENPALIQNPEDHRGLYALDKMYEKAEFLVSGEFCDEEELRYYDLIDRKSAMVDIKDLIDRIETSCQNAGVTLLVKDISQQNLIDKGFRCVKTIGVGLFPIWYGHQNSRVNLTSRLIRLSIDYNHKKLISRSDLNLDTHPFG